MIVPAIALALLGYASAVAIGRFMTSRNINKQNIGIAMLIFAFVAAMFFGNALVEFYTPIYRRQAGRVGITTALIALALGALLALVIPERFGGIRFRR